MPEITALQNEVRSLVFRVPPPCLSFLILISLSAFLSWLRLATYMAIVAVAILISFHLKHSPTELERKVALPFGLIFWLLAIACLGSGLNNYIKTVTRYSRRQALVQSGWGTQLVSLSSALVVKNRRVLTSFAGLHCRRERDYSSLCAFLEYKCDNAVTGRAKVEQEAFRSGHRLVSVKRLKRLERLAPYYG